MVSRLNFLETAPDRIDDVTRVIRELVHPGIREEGGYVGYIVLGDRETGRRSASRCGRTGKRGRRATQSRIRSGLGSSRGRAGRCGRSKLTTSSSSTSVASSSVSQRSGPRDLLQADDGGDEPRVREATRGLHGVPPPRGMSLSRVSLPGAKSSTRRSTEAARTELREATGPGA